jgi:hypothetical protein
MTLAGARTEFPLPPGNTLAGELTVGPDGALWIALASPGVLRMQLP